MHSIQSLLRPAYQGGSSPLLRLCGCRSRRRRGWFCEVSLRPSIETFHKFPRIGGGKKMSCLMRRNDSGETGSIESEKQTVCHHSQFSSVHPARPESRLTQPLSAVKHPPNNIRYPPRICIS